MYKRSHTAPKKLTEKLKREVAYRCPICSGIPLVNAHTIKSYNEVGWDYRYLLAICKSCEGKVTSGEIDKKELYKIKSKLKLGFSKDDTSQPYLIGNKDIQKIYLGGNIFDNVNTLYKYGDTKIIWFEDKDNTRTINARLYSKDGTVVTAIDKNYWTADKNYFFDIKTTQKNHSIEIALLGKRDDTSINMVLEQNILKILKSKFYVPKTEVIISEDGKLILGGVTLQNCTSNGDTIFKFN